MGDYAFVLSRIGAKGSEERARADDVFRYIVTPAVKRVSLTAKRSDRDRTPGPVTAQIVQSMVQAKVVIADLTGQNVNVYYELGIAHAFALPTVILIDSAESIAFDTQNERMIVIGDGDTLGAADAEAATTALREALAIVLDDGYVPSNVVTEAASARSLNELAPENPVASELAWIREKVESTEDSLRTLTRRLELQPGNESVAGDLTSTKAFVESLVDEGRLSSEEIAERLVTRTTSPGLDRWAEQLSERARESRHHGRAASRQGLPGSADA